MGAAVLCLIAGLSLSWLTSALGSSVGAWSVPLRLPGTPVTRPLSATPYGALPLLALTLIVVGRLLDHRAGPAVPVSARWWRAAGWLLVLTSAGFVAQLLVADTMTLSWLRGQQAEFDLLLRQFTYRVSQPRIGGLLFVPLGDRGTLVFSALRPGWYLTLAAGLLLLCVRPSPPIGPRKGIPAGPRLVPSAVLALTGVILGSGLAHAGLAAWSAHDAAALSDAGQYPAAAARYTRALEQNPLLINDPAVLAAIGRARANSGLLPGPGAPLAAAQDEVRAGHQPTGLHLLADAVGADPGNRALAGTLALASAQYAAEQEDPAPVQGLPAPVADDDLVRFTRGRLEVVAGQLTTGAADLRRVATQADSPDVRSAALTYLSMAQQAQGDLAEARRTLVRAVAEDTRHNNVVARAAATGLYSGARQ